MQKDFCNKIGQKAYASAATPNAATTAIPTISFRCDAKFVRIWCRSLCWADWKRCSSRTVAPKESVLSVTTLLFIIAVTPAASQQGDPVAIQKRFNELYAAGNYPAALVEAQKLEAGFKARFGVNHANYAIALASLADVYWRQGKYAEAEALYKRAVVIREKVLGKDHSGVADYLNSLGLILNDQGKYAEAEGLYSDL